MLLRKRSVEKQNFSLENFKISKELSFSFSKMTTRSKKRKAVEELVSVDQEIPLSGNDQNENPVVGTSKSPKVQTENLEETKSTLRKEIILSDNTKFLAENQNRC